MTLNQINPYPTISKQCCQVHGESLSDFPLLLLRPESQGNSTILSLNKTIKSKIITFISCLCYPVRMIRQQTIISLSSALSVLDDLSHHGFQIASRWLSFQCHFQDQGYLNIELSTSDSSRNCPVFYFSKQSELRYFNWHLLEHGKNLLQIVPPDPEIGGGGGGWGVG